MRSACLAVDARASMSSRESTPVRFQKNYCIWDAVQDAHITSADIDSKGRVDVDEQMRRIFGGGGVSGRPTTGSPRVSPVRLRPIVDAKNGTPFQQQIRPKLIPRAAPHSDPTLKILGDEIRILEKRNSSLFRRVVVQQKLISGFCQNEMLRNKCV